MTADPLAARRAPWTLMYHSVGDPSDDPYLVTVGPERLAAQLRWLNRHGLTGVSMRELLAARAAGRERRLVGLTFDDGYADFLELAVPALRQHGHTATVFVLPGRLGGSNGWDPEGPRKPLLDADGIREAAAAGMEIGSHGLRHIDLTTTDDDLLAREVAESRALLTELTGTPPVGFCYPYGAVDLRTLLAVRGAGYAYACAVDPGPLAGQHALPRTYIGHRDTAPRLHAKRLRHAARPPALADPALPAPPGHPGHTDHPPHNKPYPLSETPGGNS
jgi:peptidoglycan/xylan/chitin deacetylase (PgdA/CDA1 family)